MLVVGPTCDSGGGCASVSVVMNMLKHVSLGTGVSGSCSTASRSLRLMSPPILTPRAASKRQKKSSSNTIYNLGLQ